MLLMGFRDIRNTNSVNKAHATRDSNRNVIISVAKVQKKAGKKFLSRFRKLTQNLSYNLMTKICCKVTAIPETLKSPLIGILSLAD